MRNTARQRRWKELCRRAAHGEVQGRRPEPTEPAWRGSKATVAPLRVVGAFCGLQAEVCPY